MTFRGPALSLLLLLSASAAAAPDSVLVPADASLDALSEFQDLQDRVERNSTVVLAASEESPAEAVSGTAQAEAVDLHSLFSPAEVVRAYRLRMESIRTLERDITDLLVSEPASEQSFLRFLQGRFAERKTPTLDLPFGLRPFNAGVMAQNVTKRLGVNASMSAALLRAQAEGLAVRNAELHLLLAPKLPAQEATAPFHRQYNATLEKLSEAIEIPTEANQQAFLASSKLTRDSFVRIWPELRDKPEMRRDAVRRLAGLMEQSSLKALYGITSNFDPVSYSKIFMQSQRTVALVERERRFCSGYMLSAEWIMTAGHCLKRGDVTGMEAWISVGEAAPPIKVALDDHWPRTGTGLLDEDPIDFVFLHMRSDERVARHLAAIEQGAPVCLDAQPLDYEQPVVVIAYRDEAPLKVYDHAYVWFPFRVRPQRFQEISAMTGAKLQRLAEAWFPDETRRQIDFFEKNMKNFESSYQPRGEFREYRAERAGLGRRAYFGMDTDTFKGNSGAPVFAREKVCVVGVFSGGAGENARIDEGTWKEHEFAIPLSEVAAHIRTLDPAEGATPVQKASREALVRMMPN